MTDYRKLLLEACDMLEILLDAIAPNLECGDEIDASNRDRDRVAEFRSLASSPPPDLEGPTEEEVEYMARFFIEAWRTTRAGNDYNERWRDVAREAWRLGARTRRTP